MTEFTKGFYWNEVNEGDYSLSYLDRECNPDSRGLVYMHHFNEKGAWAEHLASKDKLTPFNPETDMDRLKPRIAERVKEKLEELAEDF